MKALAYPIIVAVGALLLQGCAASRQPNTSLDTDDARAYLEVLRSDFNTTKVETLNRVMKMTVTEADKFWPIYRQYEKELAAVSDRKLELIIEFMRQHNTGTLTDQDAHDLAVQFLRNGQDRLELWKKYHQQISESVSPVRAAQFLQVENQMAIFVDLNIACEMPVVGSLSPPK